MKDFLEFINSSTPEELLQLPGVTPAQAEKIIAARPFESLEDCARVNNLTGKRLSRLQEDYETLGKLAEDEPEESIEKEVEITEETPKKVKTGKFSRIILRILVWLIILSAIGAVIYFGVPYFYEKVLRPLETNTAQVGEVTAQQAEDVTRLEGEIATLQARLSTLELRADNIDQMLQSHAAALKSLEEMQTTLSGDLADQKSELLATLEQQVNLTRAIELLARSRLYLSQSNFGLAKNDVLAARNLLYSLLPTIPSNQADGLKVVLNRLDLALDNLPIYPVVAVYDVDTAWQLLVDGLPNVPELAITPVVTESTVTPSVTAEPDVTPTVEVTPAP